LYRNNRNNRNNRLSFIYLFIYKWLIERKKEKNKPAPGPAPGGVPVAFRSANNRNNVDLQPVAKRPRPAPVVSTNQLAPQWLKAREFHA
jgi:hypothetical protein